MRFAYVGAALAFATTTLAGGSPQGYGGDSVPQAAGEPRPGVGGPGQNGGGVNSDAGQRPPYVPNQAGNGMPPNGGRTQSDAQPGQGQVPGRRPEEGQGQRPNGSPSSGNGMQYGPQSQGQGQPRPQPGQGGGRPNSQNGMQPQGRPGQGIESSPVGGNGQPRQGQPGHGGTESSPVGGGNQPGQGRPGQDGTESSPVGGNGRPAQGGDSHGQGGPSFYEGSGQGGQRGGSPSDGRPGQGGTQSSPVGGSGAGNGGNFQFQGPQCCIQSSPGGGRPNGPPPGQGGRQSSPTGSSPGNGQHGSPNYGAPRGNGGPSRGGQQSSPVGSSPGQGQPGHGQPGQGQIQPNRESPQGYGGKRDVKRQAGGQVPPSTGGHMSGGAGGQAPPGAGNAAGGAGSYGQCISPEEGLQWLDQFISVLGHTAPNLEETANQIIADQFTEISNSILSLQGKQQTAQSVAAPSKQAWVQGIIKAPPPEGIQTLDVVVGCNKLVWYWSFEKVGAGRYPTNGFNLFTLTRGGQGLQAEKLNLEFDSIAWGLNTGEIGSVTYANGTEAQAAMEFRGGPGKGEGQGSQRGQ
ncbi:hypothetical protein CKM354_000440700 [Cercospora kikuchii]|uniref:NTF2-like domain-containing protein n=1 Tax=Cercospora kikuchii TaxID=84275 RepID=A0A9P3CFU4_9PEZI|nr:uncharacterized protein CKM354_000440700 [Cercospora kikuchii]GIZ41091.1 hypothetical protein CKM354_000440700 [Cercospora kikuchii]